MEHIKPLSMLGETLSRNLSDIRELIDQARRQAASVHTHNLKHTHRLFRHINVLIFEDGDFEW